MCPGKMGARCLKARKFVALALLLTTLSPDCRLLRNRVSAQQARERKKQYISDLEGQLDDKTKEIQALNSKMQEILSDNSTLRRLIVTMRGLNSQKGTAGQATVARVGRPVDRHRNGISSSRPGCDHPSSDGSQANGEEVSRECCA
jgi:hypothetical protein